MSILGSEIYSVLESVYLKTNISFTSLDTIGLQADLINVSTNMIISNGYISGLTNVGDLSSAVNKSYVDTSSQFIPTGTIGAIQFKSNDNLMTSSEYLNFTSITNILRSENSNSNKIFVEDVFLENFEINVSLNTSDYNLIMPVTNGISGQILGLNNNSSKKSNEAFNYLNGGSVWSSYLGQFLTTLNMPSFGTNPPSTEDISIGLSQNGLTWTTYLYSRTGALLTPKWFDSPFNFYITSYLNGFALNPMTSYSLLKSTDGLNWSSIFETDKGAPMICYSEYLGIFVGLTSSDTLNTISLISIDSINWTTYSQNFRVSDFLLNIIWIDELKIFFTVKSIGFPSYFISKDGINWDIYNNVFDFNISYSVWSPELQIILITGQNKSAISYDAINWTTGSYNFPDPSGRASLVRTVWCPPVLNSRPGYFVSTINGEVDLDLFLPVFSTDGLNWIIYSNDRVGNYSGIAYNPEEDIVSMIPSYIGTAFIIDFGNYLTFFNNGFQPFGSNEEIQLNLNNNFVSNENLKFDSLSNTLSATSPNTINVSTSIITNVNTNNIFISNSNSVTSGTILKSQNSFVDYTINLPNTSPNDYDIIKTDGIDSFYFTTNTSVVPRGDINSIQVGLGSGNLNGTLMTFNPDTELYIPGPISQYNVIPFTQGVTISTIVESFYLYNSTLYIVGNQELKFVPTDNYQIINQLTFNSCSNIFVSDYYAYITGNDSLYISDISGNGFYFTTMISNISITTSGTSSIPLYVQNKLCYLGLSNSILVLDVSNLITPTTVFEFGVSVVTNLLINENNLYVTRNSSTNSFMKLSYDDIAPTTRGKLNIASLNSLVINNDYAYVSSSSNLYIVEIQSFTTKVIVPISDINCIYSTFEKLYIGTNSEILIYNISNPLNISLIQSFSEVNVYGITSIGTTLYYFNDTSLVSLDTKGSELTSLSTGGIYTNQINVFNDVYNEGLTIVDTINVSNTLNIENMKLYKEIINLLDYSDITSNVYNAIINISDSSIINSNSFVDIIITNNKVTLNSHIIVGILNFEFGLPFVSIKNKNNGVFTIRVYNLREVLYGFIKIYFIIY